MMIVETTLSEWIEEFTQLALKHWDEVATTSVDKELPLDINYSDYMALESLGRLVSFAVLDKDKLVGYVGIQIGRHPHHKTKWFGNVDVFYLDVPYRRYFLFMIRKVEKVLSQKYGVEYLHFGWHKGNDLTKHFEKLGYEESDRVFVKKIAQEL